MLARPPSRGPIDLHAEHLLQSPIHLRLHSGVGGHGNHLPVLVDAHSGRTAITPQKLFNGDDLITG